jgi:hypothetical protein
VTEVGAGAAKRAAIAKELGLEHIAINFTPPVGSDFTDHPQIEAE